jgi:hypothetical protein
MRSSLYVSVYESDRQNVLDYVNLLEQRGLPWSTIGSAKYSGVMPLDFLLMPIVHTQPPQNLSPSALQQLLVQHPVSTAGGSIAKW